MKKVVGIMPDTNGRGRITLILVVVGPSRLSKVVRNTRGKSPNTRTAKPRTESSLPVAVPGASGGECGTDYTGVADFQIFSYSEHFRAVVCVSKGAR